MNAIASFQRTRIRRRALRAAAALCTAGALVTGQAGAQSVSRISQTHAAERGKSRPDVAKFRARVDAALGQGNAGKLDWGIEIADRDTGEAIYELNADHFFTPASNAKIVTTALALATLGGDYRFHTTLESKTAIGSEPTPITSICSSKSVM